MSDRLKDIALEFCRTCLGWEKAWRYPKDKYALGNIIFDRKRNLVNMFWAKDFEFWNLNVVLDAVLGWCEANEANVEIKFSRDSRLGPLGRSASVSIARNGKSDHSGGNSEPVEYYLMKACLYAAAHWSDH